MRLAAVPPLLRLLVTLCTVAAALPLAPAAPVEAQDTAALPLASPVRLQGTAGFIEDAALGDLNGDGSLDIAILNQQDAPHVQVQLSDGDGGFLPLAGVVQSGSATRFALGDLNGDGSLDIVLTTGCIFWNDGAGGFAPGPCLLDTLDPDAIAPYGQVALGDLDGDGRTDVVFPVTGLYALSQGGGRFGAPTPLPDRPSEEDAALGDVDGDGWLDMVVGKHLIRNPGGVFAEPVALPVPFAVRTGALVDLNGDDRLDYFGLRSFSPGVVLLNDGQGGFPGPAIELGSRASEVGSAFGDLDSDGDVDLITSGLNNDATVWVNNGSAGFAGVVLEGTGGRQQEYLIGDMDGDGGLDLVVVNGYFSSEIFYNTNATLTYRETPLPSPFTCVPASGGSCGPGALLDFNGDGWRDYAVGYRQNFFDPQTFFSYARSTAGIAFADGASGFRPAARLPLPEAVLGSPTTYGDLDGDGDFDLLQSTIVDRVNPTWFSGWRAFLNDGGGGFSAGPSLAAPAPMREVQTALGDLDGDGDLDLVSAARRYTGGTCFGAACVCTVTGSNIEPNVALLYNDGPAGFTPLELPESRCTYHFVLGDLNRDGDLDLVLSRGNDYDSADLPVEARLGDGLGGFGPPALVPNSAGLDSVLSLADVSGDGVLDLLLGIYPPRVAFGDGAGGFGAPSVLPYPTGLGQLPLEPVDINGDGALDLLSSGLPDGVAVQLNDGAGGFGFPTQLLTAGGTLADVDGSGHPAFVSGDAISRSPRAPGPRLANTQLQVSVGRPGVTPAGDAATGEILGGPLLNIPFRLRDREADPARAVRGFFSLDGGHSWQPAVPAAGAALTDLPSAGGGCDARGCAYSFPWDVYGSGVFGRADRVVFRIVADEGVGPHSAVGPQQRPDPAGASEPFRLRGAQVRVVEGGQPRQGATVYRLAAGQELGGAPLGGAQPFTTDGQGFLRGRGTFSAGDRLFAAAPITRTGGFTRYATSGAPTAAGVESAQVTAAGIQTLEVRESLPLLLYDLTVALEWDASSTPAYLEELRANLQRASRYLYDFTDGQLALGKVTVSQGADDWALADVVVRANNRLRPYAVQGGVVLTPTVDPQRPMIVYDTGQVSMGATWNRFGTPGQSIGEDWAIILAHELSHYLLFQDDAYLGIDDDGLLIAVGSCRGTAMGDVYGDAAATELIFDQAYWDASCGRTLGARSLGRTEWETIKAHYPALNLPAALNPGPATMPFNFTTIALRPPLTPTLGLAEPTFFLDYADGALSTSEARAFLLRADRYAIDLGSPFGGQNRLLAYGARPGDRICVFDQPRAAFGCEQAELGDERIALRRDPAWTPLIRLTPVTSLTFELAVEALPPGLDLRARLYREYGEALAPVALAADGPTYRGQITFPEPSLTGSLQLWVEEPASETAPRRETIVSYAIMGNPGLTRAGGGLTRAGGGLTRAGGGLTRAGGGLTRAGGAPVVSTDGQMIFFTPDPLVFQEGQFFTVQGMAALPALPQGKTVIGRGYSLVATAGAPVISGSVSFQYLPNDALVAGASEEGLTIHYYDGAAASWRVLPTRRDPYYNLASAPSQGAGIYALMAGVSAPTVATISPSTATNGAPVELSLTGSGFLGPVTVRLTGGPAVVAVQASAVTSTTLRATLPANLAPAAYQLSVVNGDGAASAPVSFAVFQPADARFYDFFESGAGQWTLTGEWAVTALAGASGALTDSPAGAYNNAPAGQRRVTTATSAPFSLDGLPNPVLTFRHDYVLAVLGSSSDEGRVEISTDGGATWQTLARFSGGGIYGPAVQSVAAEAVTEWGTPAWQQVTLSLADFQGTARLRFALDVDSTVSDRGWVIDDVTVRTELLQRVYLPQLRR